MTPIKLEDFARACASDMAALRTEITTLSARIAFLEDHSAPARHRRDEEQRLARLARITSVQTLAELDALPAMDAADATARLPIAVLASIVSRAGDERREQILRNLSLSRRNEVVVSLRAAPHVVEIRSALGRQGPGRIRLSDAQVSTLRSAGLEPTDHGNGVYSMLWTLDDTVDGVMRWHFDNKEGAYVMQAHAWLSLVSEDAELRALVASGDIVVRELPPVEARAETVRDLVARRAEASLDEVDDPEPASFVNDVVGDPYTGAAQ